MRALFNATAQVERLSAYTDNKAEMAIIAGVSYEGFFKPIDADMNTVALKIAGQAYEFNTEGDADIREGDYLIINNVKYGVRGVRSYSLKSHEFISCLLEKPAL